MSKWISDKRRKDIYKKHKNKCFYCGVYLLESTATIDHLIPRRLGGSNLNENLVASCKSCNSSKALKTVEEYRLYLSLKKATSPIIYSQCQVNHLYGLGLFSALGVTDMHKFYFEVKDASN